MLPALATSNPSGDVWQRPAVPAPADNQPNAARIEPGSARARPLRKPGRAEPVAGRPGGFERTVVSEDAAFDRWRAGDQNAMSVSAQRGFELFNGKGELRAMPCCFFAEGAALGSHSQLAQRRLQVADH